MYKTISTNNHKDIHFKKPEIVWTYSLRSNEQSTCDVSIVTVTNRLENLEQVTSQVSGQDFDCSIEHVVVFDGIQEELAKQQISEFNQMGEHQRIFIGVKHRPTQYVFEKLGQLRNLGVFNSSGNYIAFWDDDNWWEKDHIQTLFTLLKQKEPGAAVHSWRHIVDDKNQTTPVVRDHYPWIPDDRHRSKVLYHIQESVGILSPGNSLVRDQHGFTLPEELTEFSSVDTGEWLVPKTLFLSERTRFKARYTYTEINFGVTDDNIFAQRLLTEKTPVYCSELATLRYRLGGISNASKKSE